MFEDDSLYLSQIAVADAFERQDTLGALEWLNPAHHAGGADA